MAPVCYVLTEPLLEIYTLDCLPPMAAFEAYPLGLQVRFEERGAYPRDSWGWDFGDGYSSTLRDPVHRYDHPGTYDVSLTISGQFGTATVTRSLTIEDHAPYVPDPLIFEDGFESGGTTRWSKTTP